MGLLALAAASHRFTVAEFTAKTQQMNRRADFTTRQGAYDLRNLRGKNLAMKPGRTRRYHIPPEAAGAIAALLASATTSSPRSSPESAAHAAAANPRWTAIDRDYPPHRHARPLPRPPDHTCPDCHIGNIFVDRRSASS
jgi:hypothetical protein